MAKDKINCPFISEKQFIEFKHNVCLMKVFAGLSLLLLTIGFLGAIFFTRGIVQREQAFMVKQTKMAIDSTKRDKLRDQEILRLAGMMETMLRFNRQNHEAIIDLRQQGIERDHQPIKRAYKANKQIPIGLD